APAQSPSPAAHARAQPEDFSVRRLDDPALASFIETRTGAKPKRWTVRQLTLAALYFHPGQEAARIAEWKMREPIADALIDIYMADRLIALYRSQEAVQKPIIDIFEQRSASGGQALNLNASQALMAYQQTRLAEKDAARQQAEARVKLATTIGVPAG